ncbi:putative CPSF6/7 family protein [Helianthus annuus]|nr:putative CPSF6/7 family protein [Helianthus annuus]KAJ0498198.1 putative CPSF6/7 family protein [Helianthus annuus]KAJ0664202.1 putative CPSF6/7 family protein [Helianthus annuus]KAJ0671681.1 putative CPSF6/7 family protein [Helianthus annuus]
MNQTDAGGDPTEQFHRNEAISAVVDEGFLGEDDDDYEDLYNDVNVGEGFLQSVKKNEQVEEPVEPVIHPVVDDRKFESKNEVFSEPRVELGVKHEMVGCKDDVFGEPRVEIGQSVVKLGETESRNEVNNNSTCKEGMNGHVFNGRPCVVAFASPFSVKRMGEAQVNRNQQMAQSNAAQGKRGPGDVPGKTGGNNMPAGGNFQGGSDNNRGYGRGNWGRGNAQGMAGRGPGRGGRGMMNGGNGFGPPPMMHPQSMMGQGFDPSFGGPMGRMGGYGGFPGAPTPPFSGMMPSFPPALPGLAPHVNPAFFGRGMPMNGMGMMPGSGADGNMGMWSDPNMPGWAGDEQGGRVGESSYGEEAVSDQQFGEGSHDRGDWPNPAKEKDRRHRDDRDREVGYEKDVREEEWPERRHRDERDRERSRDRDHERSRDRDRDRDRERSRDRERGRDRHRDERDRYADHHRYREVEPEYDDEWERGRSSRGHGKSRLAQEDEHRSRSRDADYGKKRRVTAE